MIKTFDSLQKGEYLLKAQITALSDTDITLYGNHRHFLIKDRHLTKGEAIDESFAIAIRSADFQKQENYRDNMLTLTLNGDCKALFTLEKKDCRVIYTLGDSTVCNQTTYSAPTDCCGGWGQALAAYVKDKAAVSNHAEQGTHTSDCISCHLAKVLEQIKKGDLVLMQFGHNDQKQEWLKPFGGYMENLISIGNAVKEKGADIVICTPINRLIYIDGKLNNYLDDWRDGAKQAAKALDAYCIDLHTYTSRLYEEMGSDAEWLFYHSPALDRTHPNDIGAMKIAGFIYEELKNGGKI